MLLRRRELIRLALAAPAGIAAAAIARGLGETVVRAAPGLRPPPGGTSAGRCAVCGDTGHSMLDPRCPAARRLI
jgi:hypothetical protein